MVSWKPKREGAKAFCHASNPEQRETADKFGKEHDDQKLYSIAEAHQPRQDEHKSNADKQGYCIPPNRKVEPLLWSAPQLKNHIHINPNDTINPEQDIVPTGTYTMTLRQNEETRGPACECVQ